MFDWPNIVSRLHKEMAIVTFKKADGSIREMQATLADYLLPETSGSRGTTNDEVVVVFDLEVEAWRSFRKDRVIDVEFLGV